MGPPRSLKPWLLMTLRGWLAGKASSVTVELRPAVGMSSHLSGLNSKPILEHSVLSSTSASATAW